MVRFVAPNRSRLQVAYMASGAPTLLRAHALVRGLKSGKLHERNLEETSFITNRTQNILQDDSPLPEDAEIIQARIHGDFGQLKRGQFYARMLFNRGGDNIEFAAGYVSAAGSLVLGVVEPSNSGKGYLDWVQEGDDIAGNATETVNLGAANARRIVRGVIVKYHASSDVATRTLTITLRDLATAAGPTGWSIASDTWVSPTLTLTANEEGLIHVGEHGFVSTNDAGTLAYADNSSAPNPFPLEIEESETADLIIAAGAGVAGDDFDVWVQYEEWIEP